MNGNKLKKQAIKLATKKNFLFIFLFTIMTTCFSGGYTFFFIRPMYNSEVQLTYLIEDSASKDEVNAKTILLKSFKRILMSEENLIRIKTDLDGKEEDINITIEDLKKSITIILEQEELILTLKLNSKEEKIIELLTEEISVSSIDFIDQIYNKKNELKLVSKTAIKKENKSKIIVRNIVLSFMMSFVLSLSLIIIKNNIKELKKGE